jgi:D-tyrosyl-tRNA(Tyr) deacylase
MLALIQRVRRASVTIDGAVVGQIGAGLLVLVCAEQGDSQVQADKLLSKILKLRIFSDAQGKMNHCVQDLAGTGSHGGLLIVSQFTLAADTSGGNRPSFTQAAAPALGCALYDYFVLQAKALHSDVQTGVFGADMQIDLVNDGPVTLQMRGYNRYHFSKTAVYPLFPHRLSRSPAHCALALALVIWTLAAQSVLAQSAVVDKACPTPQRMQPFSQAAITLRFVGDLVLGNSHLVDDIPAEWDQLYFEQAGPYLRNTDLTLGNLEGALTQYAKTLKVTGTGRSYAFRFPPRYAKLLKDTGFTALNVANNHARDFGEQGFADTGDNLRQASIAVVGLKGQYANLQVKGLRVALLGFGFYPHQNMIQDLAAASQLIAQAKAQSDYVVVTFHGGAEGDDAVFHGNSSEVFLGEDRGNAVAFSRAAIDAGADLVVGHGPHVLRAIECYQGRPIFHSLGNFISVGGLSIRSIAALTAIGGVQLGPKGELLAVEFLPMRFGERKVPQVDAREDASHLVNWLADKAKFNGTFLKVPANEASRKALEDWAAKTVSPSKVRE